ncbi:uncharacterized protein LOC124910279 [Impatiens glandulifera]|uniref:uncharacterized protein LOC124910279 n=1 Tax=Impatiens glandulifera TaxID=253017 RepID=UPI001FB17510|nr:uncharacterized protein LOC124910279 [Impatiens glandulifera]
MAEKKELGFPKNNASNLKEILARRTLDSVRLQGHKYVELREDGKSFVFFCTLCLAPCYSDTVLYDHLKGNLHNQRLRGAKLTLLKPNPWPFNDGVLFFHEKLTAVTAKETRLLSDDNVGEENGLSLVCYDENLIRKNSSKNNVRAKGLVIPGVLLKEEISDLEVTSIGIGQIGGRFYEKDDGSKGVLRLWCEWLGKKNLSDEDILAVPLHDFSIVTFSYYYILGVKGLLDDVKYLLPPNSQAIHEGNENGGKKRKKKSISDSEGLIYSSNGSSSTMLLAGLDDPILHSNLVSSKALRKELRRKQRIVAENRMCGICQQKLLPGKDVGTILNMQTGRLLCCSRNLNGAFHLFHISCLIHWILLFESTKHTIQAVIPPKVRRRSKRNLAAKGKEAVQEPGRRQQSVYCPECQGTGIAIVGEDLQKPSIDLSEVFKQKIKVSNAHRDWMKNPEELKNCSTGFNFLDECDLKVQDSISSLKLMQFFRAAEE